MATVVYGELQRKIDDIKQDTLTKQLQNDSENSLQTVVDLRDVSKKQNKITENIIFNYSKRRSILGLNAFILLKEIKRLVVTVLIRFFVEMNYIK